ncbi:hypothetical protein LSUE1_G005074 [Lachnellula suecica]|uniref:Ubiquitin-like domain-containing protein n=1 Tax=Lachnellula suecica TaxID=602035 RepID=A0A8T9C1Y0_9HELO|nr:hypothetical protein LSUE1_G005074 [Lachnellula suecica]
MAEAIGLGASILQIAVFGASVVTTLRTLSTAYSSAEQKVKDFSSDISLTASILASLGNTVQGYEDELHFKEDNFRPAKEACERNFTRLRIALKEAKKNDDGKDDKNRKAGKGKEKSLGVWDKLMFALGGEDEIKGLVTSIETSKSTLQLLLDSVNLLVLKRLSKNSETRGQLPKVLPGNPPTIHLNSAQPGDLSSHDKNTRKKSTDDLVWGYNSDTQNAANDEGLKKEVVTTGHESIPEDPEETKDGNLPQDAENDMNIERIEVLNQSGVENEDINSRSSHFSSEDQFLYEGWLLENRKPPPSLTVVKFCGLKIKILQDRRGSDDYFVTTPKTLDKDTLMQLVVYSESHPESPHVNVLESLESNARWEVEELIIDRNESASHFRSWIIAAIVDVNRPDNGIAKKAFIWTKKYTNKVHSPSWMVVLKGGLHKEMGEKLVLPERDSDPWRQGRTHPAVRSGPEAAEAELARAAVEMNEQHRRQKLEVEEGVGGKVVGGAALGAVGAEAIAREQGGYSARYERGNQRRFSYGDHANYPPIKLEMAITEARDETRLAAAGDKKKPIRFKDALGRKFSFPFELCSTWAQAFLPVETIGPRVLAGQFDLVLPQVWELLIEPDWDVTMHMWPMLAPPRGPTPMGSMISARLHSRQASHDFSREPIPPPPPPPGHRSFGSPPPPPNIPIQGRPPITERAPGPRHVSFKVEKRAFGRPYFGFAISPFFSH